MSFVLTRRFVTHRYWLATLLMLASLAVALAGGLLSLQAHETDERYAAAFADLVRATRELEISFREAELAKGSPTESDRAWASQRLSAAVRETAIIYWAIRASDQDGVEAEETDEADLDELGGLLDPAGLAAAGEYGLEPGMMPDHLADIWEDDAEESASGDAGEGATGSGVERHLGEFVRLAATALSGAHDAPSGRVFDELRSMDETGVSPGLVALQSALQDREFTRIDRVRSLLAAGIGVFALIALGNVFLIFRPMERAVMADRAALLTERDKAIRSDQAKRDFLAVMSHELRTPMNGVLGFAALLLRSDLNETQREQVEIITRSGRHLLELLNSILDVSKIESGSYELELAPLSLAALVDDVIELQGPRAAEKRLELSAFVDPALPSHVLGDAGALRKVLLNLVGNAVKFTPSGAVAIEIHRTDAAVDGEMGVEIKVSDTGVGIAPEKLDGIFERFVQADSSTSRNFEGTGLGLAICRELAQLMDGDIAVESTPDRGSCFRVTIRLRATEPPAEPISHGIGDSLRGKRVLVVDDNDLNRRIARLQLVSCGAEVVLSGNAHLAVREVAEANATGRPFHLFVLDHMMPEVDGVGLLDMLRKLRGAAARVPAILSSSGGVTTDAAAARLGFDAAVPKPVPQAQLLATACRLVSASAAAPGAGSGVGQDARAVTGSDTLDGAPGSTRAAGDHPLILVVDDDPTNRHLARAALEAAGFAVDCAGNGIDAVEAAASRAYDLVLMDIRMPRMDGFEATARLRALSERHRTLPIIAVSAHAMAEDRPRYAAAGFAGFVAKPFLPAELAAVVERHLFDPAEAA